MATVSAITQASIQINLLLQMAMTYEKSTRSTKANLSSLSKTLSNGTGSLKLNNFTTDSHSITGSGSKDYDLDDNTTMTNDSGEAVAYSNIKFIVVVNTGSNALSCSGTFLGLSTDTFPVPVNGFHIFYFGDAGVDIVAATNDVFTVGCSADASYEVLIAGEGA